MKASINFTSSLAAVLLIALSNRCFAATQNTVHAGVARLDITPPLEMKAALGGYGERESKPAAGVHDAVWAKALLMVKGDKRFVVVTADVLGFPPKFKAAVIQRLAAEGWNGNQILLLPSPRKPLCFSMNIPRASMMAISWCCLILKALLAIGRQIIIMGRAVFHLPMGTGKPKNGGTQPHLRRTSAAGLHLLMLPGYNSEVLRRSIQPRRFLPKTVKSLHSSDTF